MEAVLGASRSEVIHAPLDDLNVRRLRSARLKPGPPFRHPSRVGHAPGSSRERL